MLATSARAFAKSSAVVDTSLQTQHGISFDIEKQFVRLTAATTQLCRVVKAEGQDQIIPSPFIVPTATQSRQGGDSRISMADAIETWPRELPWSDVHVAILRCSDQEGRIVILLQVTADGTYERIGSSKFSWLRALDAEEDWNQTQTLYIRARARETASEARGSRRLAYSNADKTVFKTLPSSGYIISHSRPANFTHAQGKAISVLDMAIVSYDIRKAIGVVTPLILFFCHPQAAESPPFALRFDRVGSYGSYLYRLGIRVGVTVWEDDEGDDNGKKIAEGDGNGKKADIAMSPRSPHVSFPISKDGVLTLRFRKTAPQLHDFVNMCIETRLPWRHAMENPKATWPIFFAHNFGSNAQSVAQATPRDTVRRTVVRRPKAQQAAATSSSDESTMPTDLSQVAGGPGSNDIASELNNTLPSADPVVSNAVPAQAARLDTPP
jgi:hypothetical protein